MLFSPPPPCSVITAPAHKHAHTFRREAGKEVVRGVNYAGLRLLKEHGDITEAEAEELEAGKVVGGPASRVSSSR